LIPDYNYLFINTLKNKFIITFIVCFFAISTAIYGEYQMQTDKKLHLGAGIIIGTGSFFICPKFEELIFDKSIIYAPVWSFTMAALAGAGKEIIYDDMMGKGTKDIYDFYYTVAGGAISGITLGIFKYFFAGRNNNMTIDINPFYKYYTISYSCSY
jgi:hypothetical protein